LLAQQGRRVLLVDRSRFPRPKACAEYVSPGAVSILERLGVFAQLTDGRWLNGMRVIAPSGAGCLLTYGRNGPCAYSVPRAALDAALVGCARRQGAEVREGYPVRALVRAGNAVRGIVGADGTRISAALVVGADGLNSVVARELRLRRTRQWPRRLGLTMHLSDVQWPENHGEMWVGRHGYVGLAPLDRTGLLSVGVVCAMPGGRLGDPTQALWRVVQQFPELARRLSAAHLVAKPSGVGPLATRVRTCAGEGFALVGDAAGFFDPFTGEGIFRALRAAELLAAGVDRYAGARRRAFLAKERLTALIQLFVQTPRLMELAVRRLQERPAQAQRLANMLGDIEPARLDLAWRLLAP
jgi:menaquinone-9 beta-reductase